MKSLVLATSAGLLALACSFPACAAMYKWVDEHGRTHYGDSVPPKYANRAGERLTKSGVSAKQEQKAPVAEVRPSEQDVEKQNAEARRQLELKRQDHALLATYANEQEIELARERELKRSQDTMRMASAGLAKSTAPEDQKKLDNLMNMSRQETDAINARFDAQKARYRELTRGAANGAPHTQAGAAQVQAGAAQVPAGSGR
jgi:hypothetical protein